MKKAKLAAFFLAAAGVLLSPKTARAYESGDYTSQSFIYAAGSNVSTANGISWPWTLGTDSSGNNFAYANQTDWNTGQVYGASAALNFTGTGIQLTGLTGPNSGYLAYTLDDGPTNFVSTCSGGVSGPRTVIDIQGLPFGPHVLNVAVTPYTDCGGTDQGIYGYNVIGGASTPLWQANSIAGYNDFALRGNWGCGGAGDGSDLSGGHCWSNDPSASLTVNFTGSLLEIFGRPDLENGSFDVIIDGSYYATVNENWGSADLDQLNSEIVFVASLPDGPHMLSLQRPFYNSGGYMQIDTIAAFSGGNGGNATGPARTDNKTATRNNTFTSGTHFQPRLEKTPSPAP